MKKVKLISRKKKLNDCLTNDFRKLIEQKIGKLDTATSFMYLFRRFGVPSFDHSDEYKILYDYRFMCDDILITVHASYHEFVYFSIHVPQKYLNTFIRQRKQLLSRLLRKSLNHNVAFFPHAHVLWEKQGTERQHKKNWWLIDIQLQKYFNEEDYTYLCDQSNCKEPEQKMFDMLLKFSEWLSNKYRLSLSKTERKKFHHYWPTLKDVPEVRQKALKIIQELLKGAYVRDCPINIRGYESPENKIYKFIKD